MLTELEKGLMKIFEELILARNFESPISLTMVGANGSVLKAKWEFSLDPEADLSQRSNMTISEGKAKDLRFPINLFLVDKNGNSANVLFEKDKKDKPILQEIGRS